MGRRYSVGLCVGLDSRGRTRPGWEAVGEPGPGHEDGGHSPLVYAPAVGSCIWLSGGEKMRSWVTRSVRFAFSICTVRFLT